MNFDSGLCNFKLDKIKIPGKIKGYLNEGSGRVRELARIILIDSKNNERGLGNEKVTNLSAI